MSRIEVPWYPRSAKSAAAASSTSDRRLFWRGTRRRAGAAMSGRSFTQIPESITRWGEVKRSIVLDKRGFERVMRPSRLFAFAGAFGVATAPALAGELRVDIGGLGAPKGAVLIGLYDS